MMTDEEIVTIAHIREALGVGAKPMLSELPAIAAELRKDAERFRWYVSSNKKPVVSVAGYLEGVRDGWTLDQWRAWCDKWMGVSDED